jgi:hypothetical protein
VTYLGQLLFKSLIRIGGKMKKYVVWALCALVLILILTARFIIGEIVNIDEFRYADLEGGLLLFSSLAVTVVFIISAACYVRDLLTFFVMILGSFCIGGILNILTWSLLDFVDIYQHYDLPPNTFFLAWVVFAYFVTAIALPFLADRFGTYQEDEGKQIVTVGDLKNLATKKSLQAYVKKSDFVKLKDTIMEGYNKNQEGLKKVTDLIKEIQATQVVEEEETV